MPDRTEDDDRKRRLGAVRRELDRRQDDGDRDLVDTVGDEQRRERTEMEDDDEE